MKLTSHFRLLRIDAKTAVVLLSALVVAFLVAVVAGHFDPGPDWFDTSDVPHADAAIIGVSAGLLAARVPTAALLWRTRRRQVTPRP